MEYKGFKDVSRHENSTVYLMDCMDGLRQTPDNYYSLALVDPPYGIGMDINMQRNEGKWGYKKREKTDWDKAIPTPEYFAELKRISQNQIIWGGNYFDLPPTPCLLIWDKVQRIDQADCEIAWTSFNTASRIFTYARGNESGFAPKLRGTERAGINIHPTQKAIKLYEWIYFNYLPEGGKVLDTHLGSQSNRIAAHKMGNIDFTAYEIDKDYFEQGNKRFETFKSQTVLF